MLKKCKRHAKGKTCVEVIAEGLCRGEECRLFKKVLDILPKLKKMYEFQAKGVIMYTIWRFDEKQEKERRRKMRYAKKWLNDFYPRIIKGLEGKVKQKRL